MRMLRIFIQFKRNSVNSEIDAFKNFLYDLINLANCEKEKLKNMVEVKVAENPDDEQDIYEIYSEQYVAYDTKYIEFANNGTLVNAYSFFEHQLKDICRMLNKFVLNKKTTYRHKKRLSYAENLRNEILSITGLDFSSLKGQWLTLDNYRKVRNVIVHNGANLFEERGKALNDQKNFALVSSFAQIKINVENGDFYIIDERLVISYLNLIDDFLTKLLDILKLIKEDDIK